MPSPLVLRHVWPQLHATHTVEETYIYMYLCNTHVTILYGYRLQRLGLADVKRPWKHCSQPTSPQCLGLDMVGPLSFAGPFKEPFWWTQGNASARSCQQVDCGRFETGPRLWLKVFPRMSEYVNMMECGSEAITRRD